MLIPRLRLFQYTKQCITVSRLFSSHGQQTTVKNFVDAAIADNLVAIFSKSTCSYCTQAKNLFGSKFPAVRAKVVELDLTEDGSAIQEYLMEKTGQRTVPNIFINQKHIGGCDAVVELNDQDKLCEIVSKA